MGCDIHVFLEYKDKEDWKPIRLFREEGKYAYPYTGRSYVLLGVLAGVRYATVDVICNHRGIPDSSCKFIKDHAEDGKSYCHDYNYAYMSELKKHKKKLKKLFKDMNYDYDDMFDNEYEMLKMFVKQLESYIDVYCEANFKFAEDLDDVRVVFWFDS